MEKFEGYHYTINELRHGLVALAVEKTLTTFVDSVFEQSPVGPQELVNFMSAYLEAVQKQNDDAVKEVDLVWNKQVKDLVVHGGEESDIVFAREKK